MVLPDRTPLLNRSGKRCGQTVVKLHRTLGTHSNPREVLTSTSRMPVH